MAAIESVKSNDCSSSSSSSDYFLKSKANDCGDCKKRQRLLSINRPVYFEQLTDPAAILLNPCFNKGTAFTESERESLKLRGLFPAAVETLDQQVRRCLYQVRSFKEPMMKHIYLANLKQRNQTLFFRVLLANMLELLPIVYTPTVGQACQEFGLQHRSMEGMYLCKKDMGRIREILNNWGANVLEEVSIIVVTDGSRILGLGDLGSNGMGIPIGKLSLYVVSGGFHPAMALPVVLDVGTNNEMLLKDEFYLGERYRRLPDDEYYKLVDEFMMAVKDKWPRCLIQFEDISNDHCFELLERYREKVLCFNDDIQGTGAVIAAGFVNALRITKQNPREVRIVFLGAGSAGIGVADYIGLCLQMRYGMTPEECRKLFYMVDSKGLITSNRSDKLAPFKLPYVRKDIEERLTDLLDVIRFVKPTALIGLSGQAGSFSEEVLKTMGDMNERPVIFALSNPTKNSECTASDAYNLTQGRCIFASGSPFDKVTVGDQTFHPAQGNNMYIFPGLGFGAWLANCSMVTSGMITASAISLADIVTQEEIKRGTLYPSLEGVRDVSAKVAAGVIEQAMKEGVAGIPTETNFLTILKSVKREMYYPIYLV